MNHGENADAFLTRIRGLLLARASAPADGRLARALRFLNAGPPAWASFQRYVRQTAFYKHERDEFRRRQADEQSRKAAEMAKANVEGLPKPVAPPFDNEEFERGLVLRFLDPFIRIRLGNSSRVIVTLETPREPFWTNGKWLDRERRVEWSQPIAELDEPVDTAAPEWPTLCVAAWDDPNDKLQKQQLGRTSLTRERLLEYCLWYQTLSQQQKQEWDAFLPTANDDAQLAARLKAFHFSDEPAQGTSRTAAEGVNAIIESLNPPRRVGRAAVSVEIAPNAPQAAPEPKAQPKKGPPARTPDANR
jgi:hypothetical protein